MKILAVLMFCTLTLTACAPSATAKEALEIARGVPAPAAQFSPLTGERLQLGRILFHPQSFSVVTGEQRFYLTINGYDRSKKLKAVGYSFHWTLQTVINQGSGLEVPERSVFTLSELRVLRDRLVWR